LIEVTAIPLFVKCGGHQAMIKLLSHWETAVINNVLWCLANFSGSEDTKLKTLLIQEGICKELH